LVNNDGGLAEDMAPERNIYRHPERQGAPSKSFSKVHDIYALGVVLLEVGLWKPAMDIFKETFGFEPTYETMKKAQEGFRGVAEKQLKHFMGPAYSEAVAACLSDELKAYAGQNDFELVFMDMVVQKLDLKRLRLENN
jgi:hypothetical protein